MTLYAAYGTNLDPARMGERCPHSPLRETGWLQGWRLTFGGEDHGWDGALATIVQDPFEQVFVAVYDVTDEDVAALDGWESTDTGLFRKTKVRVSLMNAEAVAWVYVLDAFEGGLPSATYLGTLADSAEAADAPADYVAALRARPCRSNFGDEWLLVSPADRGLRSLCTDVSVYDDRFPGRPGNRRPTRLLDVTQTYAEEAAEAARVLAEKTGVERHDIALVLGSGWLPAVDALGQSVAELSSTDLPGFAPPAVEGHAGKIRSVRAGERNLLVFLGRTHFYEGLGVRAVVHGVRTAAAAGCRTVVLTNGCGGLDDRWSPGTPVLISDHINLTATSPVEGANFVDLTGLYSPRLRDLCRQADPSLDEGVYVQLRGPHYETPAEIGMIRAIGGTLVGMSTSLEAIAAREAGMEVLGISLVTNLAAGITGEPLNHQEVLEAGRSAATRMGELLGRIVPLI